MLRYQVVAYGGRTATSSDATIPLVGTVHSYTPLFGFWLLKPPRALGCILQYTKRRAMPDDRHQHLAIQSAPEWDMFVISGGQLIAIQLLQLSPGLADGSC